MAISQPLTAYSPKVDDATLRGVDIIAPDIRTVHRALDECAEEQGPLRYESAIEIAPEQGPGKFFLLGEAPSPALRSLFEKAPEAKGRFARYLAMAPDMAPPEGSLEIVEAKALPCNPKAPMDVFLHMLERDATTTPASLEGLFEALEAAHLTGYISLEASHLSLTDKGRETIALAGPAIAILSDATMQKIDLLAQEVADGRLSLREAIYELGCEADLSLPLPGAPDRIDAKTDIPAGTARIDLGLFAPVLAALSRQEEQNRSALGIVALAHRLETWGLTPAEAANVIAHDIRCLRAFSASQSHGLLSVDDALAITEEEGLGPVVDALAADISDELLQSLAGASRATDPDPLPEIEPQIEPPVIPEPSVEPPRRSWLIRLLRAIFRR